MLRDLTDILRERLANVEEEIREFEANVAELKELEAYYQRVLDAIITTKNTPKVEYDIENFSTTVTRTPINKKLNETEKELKAEIEEIDCMVNHYEEKIKGLKHSKINISRKLDRQINKQDEEAKRINKQKENDFTK